MDEGQLMDRIRVDWRNATDHAVEKQHGVSRDELADLQTRIREITEKMAADREAGNLRYRNLPTDGDMLANVKRAVENFRPRCEILVVLGIGGSALGNIALQSSLNSPAYNLLRDDLRPGPQLFVLDNVDPDLIGSVIEFIKPRLDKTVVNVISKSGETSETGAQFLLFRDLLQGKLDCRYKDCLLVTTAPEQVKADGTSVLDENGRPKHGDMREICIAEEYKTLEVPKGVGGRFSVLSAVGLFSAAMCGIDIDALLKGAEDMDQRVQNPDLFANPAAMIAAIHYLLDKRGKRISVMMPYSNALYSLADWYRQLWAESLGKKKIESGREVFVGQTPVKALGTTDQHSQIQLYREGPNDKIITFLQVEQFARQLPISNSKAKGMEYLAGHSFNELITAEKRATEYALRVSQRPTMTVLFPSISPHTVGQFIYLYEVATSYMGELLELGEKTYDQDAVELGKKTTFALMGREGPEYDKLRNEIGPVAQHDPEYML